MASAYAVECIALRTKSYRTGYSVIRIADRAPVTEHFDTRPEAEDYRAALDKAAPGDVVCRTCKRVPKDDHGAGCPAGRDS